MYNFDSLILDVDGTIWNSTEVVAVGWNNAIDENFPETKHVTAEILTGQFGKTMDVIADNLFPNLTKEQKTILMDKCCEHEQIALQENKKNITYPNVVETIKELSKKIPVFIVSNCQAGYIELVMEKNQITQYITDFECYGNNGKTKAENIKLLIERNNLKNPVYVGDTQGDCDACKEAGVPFVFASYGFGVTDNYLCKIQDFAELKTLFETYDYYFFDLDGTLTDPALGITNSFVHAFKHYGMEIPSYEKLLTFIGPPLVDTFKNSFGFSEEKAAEGVKVYREYFADKGLFENSVYDGIETLLQKLKSSGKHLIVATSKPEEYSVRILEHFNLDKYFDNICGSCIDESRSKKGEVIAYAIERNHITDKSRILMIGDREHDVIGAKENGIKSCGVLFGYGSKNELIKSGADYIVATVEELDKLIGKI